MTTRPSAGARRRAASKGLAQVLDALNDREIPATAQDLHAELREHDHQLGIATIYRALHELRETGGLHAFPRANGLAFRACHSTPHYHLLCTHCGRVQEQPIPDQAGWLTSLAADGFTAQTVELQVYGRCRECHSL